MYSLFFIASGRLDSRPVNLSTFAKNIFYMYSLWASYGAFLLAKAPRGTKINHVISSLPFYTVAEGSLAFKSRGFRPIIMRYNSVPHVLVT